MNSCTGLQRTTAILKPRFEGTNICTWVGFKHVMYLIEEAVIEHFRAQGLAPRPLYEDKGLCLEIVNSDVRILHALHLDDHVQVNVTPLTRDGDTELTMSVEALIERDGKELKAVTGKVNVLFRFDDSMVTAHAGPAIPDDRIRPYTHTRILRGERRSVGGLNLSREPGVVAEDVRIALGADKTNSFVWKWHVPYFYCHYNDRLQHSGYLRLMEEVLDLFVAERGISIRTLLANKRWIPVVPAANLQMLDEAMMEDTLYTVFTVEDIFKATTYRSRMDCYVERHGSLVHTASGHITHGYARIDSRRDWSLVEFDAEVLAALRGERSSRT
ncbi:thioesterase family protein [Paraburkholderia dilworthii]|uniref:thioesterase family protein n=1 Tax=Paraburkholderia dilworthii TaxID=948106 RepID=UPI0003F7E22B|nr:thioesterase family protein [Paraburkholderia dilworthii]